MRPLERRGLAERCGWGNRVWPNQGGVAKAGGVAYIIFGGGLGQHTEHDDGAGPWLLLGRFWTVILVPVVTIGTEGQCRGGRSGVPLPGGLRALIGGLKGGVRGGRKGGGGCQVAGEGDTGVLEVIQVSRKGPRHPAPT